MPTTVNLSVGSGETKNLTFNCGGTFVPDDIEFVITGSGGDTNTTLSGIAYCSTGASTTAKVATMPGFALSSGQRIILYLSTTNSKASATLNVNSTGAKTIKIGGANTTTSNFTAGYWVCNYDGTNWNLSRLFADLKQDNTTTSAYRKVILSGNTYSAGTAVSDYTGQTYQTQYVEVQPSTGKIRSNGFVKASPSYSTGILLADGTDIQQSTFAGSGHTHAFSDLTSHPDTISGYGITDASISGQTVTIGSNSVTVPTVPSNIVNTITTSAGTHSTISSATGNVSFNIPTNTSHLTNDSGFITSYVDEKVKQTSIPSTSAMYPILTSSETSLTSGTAYEAKYSTKVKIDQNSNLILHNSSTGSNINSPAIHFVRGTVSDTYVDWGIQNAVGVFKSYSRSGSTWTERIALNSSGNLTLNGLTAPSSGTGIVTASQFVKSGATSTNLLQAGGGDIALSSINISSFNNDSGYTTNTGTVTSVGLSNGGGLSISGSPITGSGTITIGHSNSVTAGTNVGNNTTTSLSHGGTFVVPYFSYDSNGHITSANTKTLTLPSAAGDSDIHTGVAYCGTAASTGAKEAILPGFSIDTSTPFKTHSIILYVANTNTYSGNCTLNVNGIGAMGMKIWSGSSWNTVSGNALKKGYFFCYYDGNSNSDWYLIPMTGGGDSGSIVCTNSSTGTTNTAVSSGDVYLNYVEGDSVVSSIALHGMGGTTITSTVVSGNPPQIRINSTTGGGGGGAEYINDLYDVYTSPYNGQFLQFNGSIWTGGVALTQVSAGSGLNATSGNTTNDGGSITASCISTNNPPVTSTGTLHLTRVNTSSYYNDGNNNTLTKLAFGPTANKTVTSNSNTFDVPYYKVDKFGRVTDSITRTITISGLGGGGGGSTVSAVASESNIRGYKAGAVTIDNSSVSFDIQPARAVFWGSSAYELTPQGVVRPYSEIDFVTAGIEEGTNNNMNFGCSYNDTNDITRHCTFYTDGPDISKSDDVVFIPITFVYRYNARNQRYESIPYLAISGKTASDLDLFTLYSNPYTPQK